MVDGGLGRAADSEWPGRAIRTRLSGQCSLLVEMPPCDRDGSRTMATTDGATRTDGSTANARKLVAQIFVSMDGVMQAPGGQEGDLDSGFGHPGWSLPYWDESMGRAIAEYTSQPADVVLGRRTYDFFAAYWPEHRDQVGSSLNHATKYVASPTERELQ